MNSVYFKPVYTILFIKENGSFFAVAQFEIYKGRWCDELLFAEVKRVNLDKTRVTGDFAWEVIWQDDWKNPIQCETFSAAERYIRENYLTHTPHVNGRTYPLKTT